MRLPSQQAGDQRRQPASRGSRSSTRSTLADGSDVTIRPIRADDIDLEIAFVKGLSPQSGYQRLLSPRKLSYDELVRLTDVDATRELALIATSRDGDADRQVGVARCVIDCSGEHADLAIVIADDWQGKGLGEKLLRSLMEVAADAGVQVLGGITLSTNSRLIGLVRKLGFELHREPGDATVTRLTRTLTAPMPPAVSN